MKKFEGCLICTDLDGTLLKNDLTISDRNKQAIEYFKSEGGLFTFVTGRMPSYLGDIYSKVRPNCPIGCINGGGVYDCEKQKYLWTCPLPHSALDLVKSVDDTLENIGIIVVTFDKTYFCKENATTAGVRKVTGVPNLVIDYNNITEPISKVMFADANTDNLLKVIGILNSHSMSEQFSFIRSELALYEILPKNINKGTALSKLCEILDIDIKNTIAFGDYDNDIGMLKTAGLGIAVSNATDSAKAAADLVTVSNEEDALAVIIDAIDSGKVRL